MDSKEASSKRPQDSDWKQQRLKAWQPLLTPNWIIGTLALITAVFIPIGIGIVVSSSTVVEISYRYDALAANTSSTFQLPITTDMKAPVYVYYELSNYYQNHRRYVKSRSDEQLRGSLDVDIALCDPIEQRSDANGTSIIVPCGLIANSFFNDTFNATHCRGSTCVQLAPTDGSPVADYPNWKKTGIAWASDVQDKFKYKPLASGFTGQSLDGFALPRVDNEDLIVWMRTAGLPKFRKLYRVISNLDLNKGDVLNVQVLNNYPVSQFDGTKSLVLSTTSWLGGKNSFLGWAYVAVGAISGVLAIAFAIKQCGNPRRLGDMQYFSWAPTGNKQMDSGDE